MTASEHRYHDKFSLEFFPPKDPAGLERLVITAKQLIQINPRYISVTYGAGGSTKIGTEESVKMVHNLGHEGVPHLSCVGAKVSEVVELLDYYKANGVRSIVALRGDLPSGMGLPDTPLRHAVDLVRLIREHSGDYFTIRVAAYPEMHPQADSPDADIQYFIEKMQAGADSAITQYFYNADAYFDFIDRVQAKGMNKPIIAGVMPITNYTQLARFSQMCGAELPRWIVKRLASYGDDRASIKAFGHDVVLAMCERLLSQGAPGVHFYTLNHAEPVLNLWRDLA